MSGGSPRSCGRPLLHLLCERRVPGQGQEDVVERRSAERDVIDRVTIAWPNGRSEEFNKVATGKQYDCVEGKGILESSR